MAIAKMSKFLLSQLKRNTISPKRLNEDIWHKVLEIGSYELSE